MVSESAKYVSGLLAVALLAGGGCCANLCQSPVKYSVGLSEFDLGCALDRLCTGAPLKRCGSPVEVENTSESTACEECQPTCVSGGQPLADLRLKCKWRPGCNVQPGPPPVSYRPPKPPEFLPVPTQPIFAAVTLADPEPMRGAVEVDFGTQLLIPGRE